MNHTRRPFLEGLGATGFVAAFPAAAATARPASPDFGPDVFIVDPGMTAEVVQTRVDTIFREQERAHSTNARHAILFKPGHYSVDVNVGFFMQVVGLSCLPGDVAIVGHVHAEADWVKGMALVNFRREVENLSVRPTDGADRWAVSQAAPYRRVHLHGDLALDDGGWSSGGFFTDCQIDGTVLSGTQQQWFTRNSHIGARRGSNWTMMFAGVEGAPPTGFPEPPYTSLPTVPLIRAKPFPHLMRSGEWAVFVPALRRKTRGTSWTDGAPAGTFIPLSRFLIAHSDTPVSAVNAALTKGKHLLHTPGIYRIREPLRIEHAGMVVPGLGLSTLLAERGSAAIIVADVPGVAIAGLLIDAGPVETPVLVQIGPRGAKRDHSRNPTLLADPFFRVGGATVGKAQTCLEINSHHVISDHLWIWRADHGDRDAGRVHVGWTESTAGQGLIVNGDDVTVHGLFVEHFQKYQMTWNGDCGRTYFYQCELPNDPPNQASYISGKRKAGPRTRSRTLSRHTRQLALASMPTLPLTPRSCWAARSRHRDDPESGLPVSRRSRSAPSQGTVALLVNYSGAAARPGAVRQTLTRYP